MSQRASNALKEEMEMLADRREKRDIESAQNGIVAHDPQASKTPARSWWAEAPMTLVA